MLFRYEIKSNIKKIIYISIFSFLLFFIIFTSFKNNNISKFNDLPILLKSIIGMSNFNMSNLSGSYFLTLNYLVILYALFIINLGVKTTLTDFRKKNDFIFVVIPRKKILKDKIIANIVNIFILLFISTITELILLVLFKESNFTYLFLSKLMLLFALILIYFIGVFIGTYIYSSRFCSNISAIIIALLYVLNIIGNAFDIKILNYIVPWYYAITFNLLSGSINLLYIIIVLATSTILTLISYKKFSIKDL